MGNSIWSFCKPTCWKFLLLVVIINDLSLIFYRFFKLVNICIESCVYIKYMRSALLECIGHYNFSKTFFKCIQT